MMNLHRCSSVIKRMGWTGLCAAFLLTGCEFLDPTDVANPRTTIEDLANAREPTKALLPGLGAQMARALRAMVIISGTVSDNFAISGSNLGGELGDPYLVGPDGGTYNSTGANGAYWNLQELRAFADFVLDSIAPADETATEGHLAQALYYRGMAFLMQGENFAAVPTKPDTEPTPSAGLLQLALDDFNEALSLAGTAELGLQITAALARAHRAAGHVDEAEDFAQQALAADPTFVVNQPYSEGEISNPYLVGGIETMQPLPRLDFLDPKYPSESAPIPLAKAEEMHLILAEVALARGDHAAAAGHLSKAVETALNRPTVEFDDPDARLNADLTVRPRDAAVLVRAGPNSPFRAGLVLTRPGLIQLPTISGTSLDADSVAVLGNPEDVRHALWLARQEILFLEGRRIHDLGVKLPISGREIDASPVIERGDPGTEVVVPEYIPRGTIDDFTPSSPYQDPATGDVLETQKITIAIDMNRVLAQQKVSPFGPLP